MRIRDLMMAMFAGWLLVAASLVYAGNPHCTRCRRARSGETPLGRIAQERAQAYPWHGAYYETAWGTPVAVAINPRVGRYTEYAWGVGGFRTQRANHQFGRTYPGGPGEGGFLPTPRWPSDTTQFGSYYVRGPW